MPIKVTLSPTYLVPVEALIPNENGVDELHKFKIEVARTETDHLEHLAKEGNTAMLRQKVKGWQDVNLEDGTPLEFSAENLEALLRIPQAVIGMAMAFWTSQARAKRGN